MANVWKSYAVAGAFLWTLGLALAPGASAQAATTVNVFLETFNGLAPMSEPLPVAAGAMLGTGLPGDMTDGPSWIYTVQDTSPRIQVKSSGTPFLVHPELVIAGGSTASHTTGDLGRSIDNNNIISVTMKCAFSFPTNMGTAASQDMRFFLYDSATGQGAGLPGYMLRVWGSTNAAQTLQINTTPGTSSPSPVGVSGALGDNLTGWVYQLTAKWSEDRVAGTTTCDWAIEPLDGGPINVSGTRVISRIQPDGCHWDRVRVMWAPNATCWIDNIEIIKEIAGVPEPEIAVDENAADIANNSGPLDFGREINGGPALSKTFRVRNLGDSALSCSDLSVPAGYAIAEGLSASIDPGKSDTFTVELPTSTDGVFAGNISFGTNDSNENPFSFAVTGEIYTPSGVPDWKSY